MIDNCIKSLELMEFNKCLFCLMILAFRVHLPKSIFLHASLIRWWRWPMLKFRIKETRCSSATWPSSTSSELTRPHVYTERQCYIKNQFTSAVWFVAIPWSQISALGITKSARLSFAWRNKNTKYKKLTDAKTLGWTRCCHSPCCSTNRNQNHANSCKNASTQIMLNYKFNWIQFDFDISWHGLQILQLP